MTEFTYDEELFSDLHKDAMGFRPRGHEFYSASRERKQEIWDSYIDTLNVELERESAERVANSAAFEKKISDLIDMGAGDRETAIRWLMTSDDEEDDFTHYGVSWALYSFGLTSNYGLEIGRIREAMMAE
jgi:hypothetical protein